MRSHLNSTVYLFHSLLCLLPTVYPTQTYSAYSLLSTDSLKEAI